MLRYAITPGNLTSPKGEPADRLIARCAELAYDGVDFLLLREKHLEPPQMALLARRVAHAVADSQTKVLVPGLPSVAMAAGADGVHLSSQPGQLTPDQVRRKFAEAWVSFSCHTVAEVQQAAGTAALVLFAPVFAKVVNGVEVSPGTGLTALHAACEAAAETPVLALGGVTTANAEQCIQAGAAGIAGIRLFFADL